MISAQDEDFSPISFNITVPANTTIGTEVCSGDIEIPIIDDYTVEDVQFFTLRIQEISLDGVTYGGNNTVLIYIIDDDSK